MNSHLNEEERKSGNKRNEKGSKRLKTMSGEVILTTPEDRKSTFAPQIIKKYEIILADNLAPQIIGLYSKGMSFRDISDQSSVKHELGKSNGRRRDSELFLKCLREIGQTFKADLIGYFRNSEFFCARSSEAF